MNHLISKTRTANLKQAINACEWDLCWLTMCFEFQSRSRKGHKKVPCKWYSELQCNVNCKGAKSR